MRATHSADATLVIVSIAAVGLVGFCFAGESEKDDRIDNPIVTDDVPLYTNADLDRLPPLPQQEAPAAQPAEGQGDWELLFRMLALERQRLESERAEAFARERMVFAQQEFARAASCTHFQPLGTGFFGDGFFAIPPHIPTAQEMFEGRVRVPLGQRGITSAGDAFRESVTESHQRFSQPPLGLRH